MTGKMTAVGRALIETGTALTDSASPATGAEGEVATEAESETGGTTDVRPPLQDGPPPFDGYNYQPTWNDTKSPQAVVNQWFGQGAYENIPVVGGIAKLEKDHGTKWRKPWKNNKSLLKRLSRMKAVAIEY